MKSFLQKLSIENYLLFTLAFIPPAFLWFGYYYEDLVVKLFLLQVVVVGIFLNAFTTPIKITALIKKDKINLYFLLFLGLLILSVPFALDPMRALSGSPSRYDGLSTYMIYAILFFAARSLHKIPIAKLTWVFVSASLIALYGIAQSLGYDFLPASMRFGSSPIVIAFFGNPNFFGIYLVLMMPLAYISYIERKQRIAFVAFALMLYALLATRTMGAWIGALGAAICYYLLNRFWLKKSMNKKAVYGVLAVTVGVILLFSVVNSQAFLTDFLRLGLDISEVAKEGSSAETAGSFRIFIWSRVIKMIQERPLFGFGIENMGIAFQARYAQDMKLISSSLITFDHAHNEYLHYALTSGIPSLLAYLVFIATLLLQGLKSIKHDPIRLMIMIGILGYLAQALFASSVLYVAYIFWIFLGLLVPNSQE